VSRKRSSYRSKKRLLIIIIVIMWMSIIFFFSSQSYQQQDLRPWLQKHLPETTIEHWFSWVSFTYAGEIVSIDAKGMPGFVEFFIRKAAHIGEYLVLGGLLFLLLATLLRIRARVAMPIAWCLCVLYAISDELHQSTSGYRVFKAQDVVLDSIAALFGITLVSAYTYWRSARTRPREVLDRRG
jgi:VanZ family protein